VPDFSLCSLSEISNISASLSPEKPQFLSQQYLIKWLRAEAMVTSDSPVRESAMSKKYIFKASHGLPPGQYIKGNDSIFCDEM
jgi:hypothetical protein